VRLHVIPKDHVFAFTDQTILDSIFSDAGPLQWSRQEAPEPGPAP
jgi:hypothetical protein